MRLLRMMTWAFWAGAMVAGAGAAASASYPGKPVRIVTSEPGSSLDFAARVVAQGLTTRFGQQVIVENRRVLSVETVARASSDGYTLLAYGSPLWITPLIQAVSYDPARDFAPVALVLVSPNVLVVHPSVGANSVKELIAVARARPGELNYGSSVTGGSPHLAAELFKSLADVNIVRVPFRGVAAALTDVVGGRVQVMFPTVASGMPHAKAGRLKALAITSAQSSVLVPGMPTIAATGLPGYEYVSMQGIFAPAGTPAMVVDRLNREIVRFINGAEARHQFLNSGAEVASDTPSEFAATIRADRTRMAKLIKTAGLRAD